MTSPKNFEMQLKNAALLADALEQHTTELLEAAALDAGFPVKITDMEVRLAVEHLRTMAEEIGLVENGKPYGTVAAIFPYDAPTIMLALSLIHI